MSFLAVLFSLSASFILSPLWMWLIVELGEGRMALGPLLPPLAPLPPPLYTLHSCTVSDFSSPLLGLFYALFPWCSDWCQGLVIWGNERLDGGHRVPLCLWHVSAELRSAVLRWGPLFGRGHCWGCLLRSLSQSSFPFQSRAHECKNSGRKLITPRREKVGAREREGKTERDGKESKKGEWGAGVFFTPFVPPKVPLILFPSLFHQDPPMNGITDKAISRVTQIYFGCSAIVYFYRTRGDLSGDNLVSIKDLNGFCGDSGVKFNLFLIYYSRYEKEKNWMADGLKIGAVPLLYPQRTEALHHIDWVRPPQPSQPQATPTRARTHAHTEPSSCPERAVTLNQLKQ